MTGKLIFKMEMYKFFQNRSFLITAGIIGLLNIFSTISLINAIDNGASDDLSIVLVALVPLQYLASILIMMIYPLQAVTIDYKNNVMAMMVASGVNRRKLYFAKVGAIILSSIILTAIMVLIPIIIFTAKINAEIGLDRVFEEFSDVFSSVDLNIPLLILLVITTYLAGLLLMVFCSILSRSVGKAILVFLGVSFVYRLVFILLVNTSSNVVYYNSFDGANEVDASALNSLFGTASIINAVFIALFIFISLKTLERQNL